MLFKTLSLSVAALLLAVSPLAGAKKRQSAPAEAAELDALKPLAESDWDYEKARHLLARAGFSGTPKEVSELRVRGLRGAVDYLVNFEDLPEFEGPFEISPRQRPQYPKGLVKGSPEARKIRMQVMRAERRQFAEMRNWWIRRMALTNRPLEEKLTLFWHGLLVSGYRTVRDSYGLHQQNQLYRGQAAGNYGELLHGLVHDPAMLRYLDNNTNVRGRPNENLGREILELFSMGEGQGYTEQDIKEGARALTGNTYDRQAHFVFRPRMHDDGEKTIFGQTGNFDSDGLVDLILEQPATARYVAGKLHTFFAYENGGPKVIDGLAEVLRKNDYELKPLLRTLFLSRDFYSENAMGTQIKSPVSLVIGTVRTLEIKEADYAGISRVLISMEQELFEPPNVKGWDGGEAWMNTTTLFNRYNFAGLVEARLRGYTPKGPKGAKGKAKGKNKAAKQRRLAGLEIVGHLRRQNLQSSAEIVDHLAKTLFVVNLTPGDREQLIAYLDEGKPLPPTAEWKFQGKAKEDMARRARIAKKLMGVLVLMMSMPEYQMT